METNRDNKQYFSQIPDSLLYLLTPVAQVIYHHILRRKNAKKKDGTAWDIHRTEISMSLGLSLTKVQECLKELVFYKLLIKVGIPGAESFEFVQETYEKYLHTCPKDIEMKPREVKERPYQKGKCQSKLTADQIRIQSGQGGDQIRIQSGTRLESNRVTRLESNHKSISDERTSEKRTSESDLIEMNNRKGSENQIRGFESSSATIQEPKALSPAFNFSCSVDNSKIASGNSGNFESTWDSIDINCPPTIQASGHGHPSQDVAKGDTLPPVPEENSDLEELRLLMAKAKSAVLTPPTNKNASQGNPERKNPYRIVESHRRNTDERFTWASESKGEL